MKSKKRPIILIHGLWNNSNIFKSISAKLEEHNIEYFAPTLIHDFGKISIIELALNLNKIIIEKYGLEKEVDILGFSMGGIIGNYWISKLKGYKRTIRFISIGSPHNGTLMAQFVPSYLLKGISEMKLNSNLLKELDSEKASLKKIQCISFYTIWDLMVFPGWKACLPIGMKFPLNVLKHRNLVKEKNAINKIIEVIIKT